MWINPGSGELELPANIMNGYPMPESDRAATAAFRLLYGPAQASICTFISAPAGNGRAIVEALGSANRPGATLIPFAVPSLNSQVREMNGSPPPGGNT